MCSTGPPAEPARPGWTAKLALNQDIPVTSVTEAGCQRARLTNTSPPATSATAAPKAGVSGSSSTK